MIEYLPPDWPAPANVCALTTTRAGGVSAAPFATLNLGDHVGDDAAAVATNRKILLDACTGLHAVSWLEQVHGVDVVAADISRVQRADAQFTREPGLACTVMTADCLPVLFCNRQGTQVAAAHAGWRGLCAGVLEAAVATFADPTQVLAWLGPAIGPRNFEVGAEVRQCFLDAAVGVASQTVDACFATSPQPKHYLADMYALARLRLRALGITAVFGGGLCTVADGNRFYSYRRDGVCGRMASLIYLIQDAAIA